MVVERLEAVGFPLGGAELRRTPAVRFAGRFDDVYHRAGLALSTAGVDSRHARMLSTTVSSPLCEVRVMELPLPTLVIAIAAGAYWVEYALLQRRAGHWYLSTYSLRLPAEPEPESEPCRVFPDAHGQSLSLFVARASIEEGGFQERRAQ